MRIEEKINKYLNESNQGKTKVHLNYIDHGEISSLFNFIAYKVDNKTMKIEQNDLKKTKFDIKDVYSLTDKRTGSKYEYTKTEDGFHYFQTS